MKSHQPHVAVFFGGSAANHDLSRETGQAVCNHLPRSKYHVVPVRVTEDGNWQVPLGTLPRQGPIDRMLDGLFKAIPAVSARQGLERLLLQPIRAMMSTIRGKGGDDGALHSLGQTLHIPVVGSPVATCQHTAHKHLLAKNVEDVAATPFSRHFRQTVPREKVMDIARSQFTAPFFLKPTAQEGSHGIEEIGTPDELMAALNRTQDGGDIMLQERAEGPEISVSVIEDESGNMHVLPATRIVPSHTSFYDYLAKRRAGRVGLKIVDFDTPEMEEAALVAQDLYRELGCRDYASFDLILTDEGPQLLEVNTIPTLTEHTPFKGQLAAAGIHPTHFLDSLIERRLLGVDTE